MPRCICAIRPTSNSCRRPRSRPAADRPPGLGGRASTAILTGRRARMPRCHSFARSARERALRMTVLAPSASSFLSRMSPWRLMPPSRRFKPLEAPRGVKPHPQLAAPVMRRSARLDPNQRRFEPGEKPEHLRAPQPLLQNALPARVFGVNLKYRFGDIQPDRDTLHGDGLRRWSFIRPQLWHMDAVRGPSTQHCERSGRGRDAHYCAPPAQVGSRTGAPV